MKDAERLTKSVTDEVPEESSRDEINISWRREFINQFTSWRSVALLAIAGSLLISAIRGTESEAEALKPETKAQIDAILRPHAAKIGGTILRKTEALGAKAYYTHDQDKDGGIIVNFVTRQTREQGGRINRHQYEVWARMMMGEDGKPDPATTYEVDLFSNWCDDENCSGHAFSYYHLSEDNPVFDDIWYAETTWQNADGGIEFYGDTTTLGQGEEDWDYTTEENLPNHAAFIVGNIEVFYFIHIYFY